MTDTIITLAYLLGVPLLVMHLARRWRWMERVSPMPVLYLVGLAVANLVPPDNGVLNVDMGANSLIESVAVPLSIPLMLMGCDPRRWQLGQALKVFATGLVAVLAAVVAGYFLFRPAGGDAASNRAFAEVSAVATGIYTGGIPNMGAIKQAVGMDDETYLYLTSYDLMATGLYLVFIIFAGKQVFRGLLPGKKQHTPRAETSRSGQADSGDKAGAGTPARPFDRQHWRGSLAGLGLTVAIAAAAYAVAKACSKGSDLNMTVLILTLTTLAIGASLIPAMRRQEQLFDMGLYVVYVFCLAVATSCDVRQMDLGGSLPILYYVAFVIFGSLVLQVALGRLLRIEGDAVMVGSVALVNSPPFVPMAAALLGNREVVALGISIGLIGYMIGNYLGVGVFYLLN